MWDTCEVARRPPQFASFKELQKIKSVVRDAAEVDLWKRSKRHSAGCGLHIVPGARPVVAFSDVFYTRIWLALSKRWYIYIGIDVLPQHTYHQQALERFDPIWREPIATGGAERSIQQHFFQRPAPSINQHIFLPNPAQHIDFHSQASAGSQCVKCDSKVVLNNFFCVLCFVLFLLILNNYTDDRDCWWSVLGFKMTVTHSGLHDGTYH